VQACGVGPLWRCQRATAALGTVPACASPACRWNAFGAEISEQLIRDTADLLVNLGLRDAGYRCRQGLLRLACCLPLCETRLRSTWRCLVLTRLQICGCFWMWAQVSGAG
jgi:hypothetical protein